MFLSVQRVRQRLSRAEHGNQVLNSTSAGPSTIDVYVQQETAGEDCVIEDPDFQVVADVQVRTGADTCGGNSDLEKGVAFPTQIGRKDSAMPNSGDQRSRNESSG